MKGKTYRFSLASKPYFSAYAHARAKRACAYAEKYGWLARLIQIESSCSDRKENTLVNTFLADGCRCKLNCHVSIGIERHRGNCAELSKRELDMAILGQLANLKQPFWLVKAIEI